MTIPKWNILVFMMCQMFIVIVTGVPLDKTELRKSGMLSFKKSFLYHFKFFKHYETSCCLKSYSSYLLFAIINYSAFI